MNTDKSVNNDLPFPSNSSKLDDILNLCYLAGKESVSTKLDPCSEQKKLNIEKEWFEKRLINLVGKHKANQLLKKLECYICSGDTLKQTMIWTCNQSIWVDCFDKIVKNNNRNQRKCP